jgi:uncharacterized repeat protein (TIGR03803 family)
MTKLRTWTLAALAITLPSLSEPGLAATPTEKVLYAFRGGTDGAYSQSTLIFDAAGDLYGTTTSGGTSDDGTVFELTRALSGWSETVLYSFHGGVDGKTPVGNLVMDGFGNLYGTTAFGGTGDCEYGCGTVFELTPPAVNGEPWIESIIYSFQGGTDGVAPTGEVTLDTFGNLYGTTQEGGSLQCPNDEDVGCGTVFELSLLSGVWTKTILYNFQGGKHNGAFPSAGVTMDIAGNLYGTTSSGGTKNLGTVYQLYSSSGNWSEKLLYSFVTYTSGRNPHSTLAFNNSGDLLGTAQGGPSGFGVVFALTPSSEGAWTETVIFQFNSKDGGIGGGLPWQSIRVETYTEPLKVPGKMVWAQRTG